MVTITQTMLAPSRQDSLPLEAAASQPCAAAARHCKTSQKSSTTAAKHQQQQAAVRVTGECQGDTYIFQTQISSTSHSSTVLALRYPAGSCPEADSTVAHTASEPCTTSSKGGVAGEPVVILLFKLRGSNTFLQRVKDEICSMNSCTHPHIARIRDLVKLPDFQAGFAGHKKFCSSSKSTPAPAIGVVLDPARCTLEQYLAKFKQSLPEGAVRWWFQQLVLSVSHCHDKGIKVGEILPSNILIQPVGTKNQVIKLAGLGKATKRQLPMPNLPLLDCNSVYTAPEAATRQADSSTASPDDDEQSQHQSEAVWSCGVVLLHMLFPQYFPAIAHPSALSEVLGLKRKRTSFSDWVHAILHHPDASTRSKECIDLLTKMLQEDPAKRATMQEIFENPWFRQSLPPGAEELNKKAAAATPSIQPEGLESWLNHVMLKLTGVDIHTN